MSSTSFFMGNDQIFSAVTTATGGETVKVAQKTAEGPYLVTMNGGTGILFELVDDGGSCHPLSFLLVVGNVKTLV